MTKIWNFFKKNLERFSFSLEIRKKYLKFKKNSPFLSFVLFKKSFHRNFDFFLKKLGKIPLKLGRKSLNNNKQPNRIPSKNYCKNWETNLSNRMLYLSQYFFFLIFQQKNKKHKTSRKIFKYFVFVRFLTKSFVVKL